MPDGVVLKTAVKLLIVEGATLLQEGHQLMQLLRIASVGQPSSPDFLELAPAFVR